MIKSIIRIFPLIALFALSLGFFVFAPRLIKIKAIICESQFGLCSESMLADLGNFESLSISDAKQKTTAYLKDQINVDQFTVRFLLPNKLKVVLVQKKPIFGLQNRGQSVALVDKDGLVLSYQESTLLPLLETVDPPPAVGERVDVSTLNSLTILAYMNNLLEIKLGKMAAESLTFNLSAGQTLIFPLNEDVTVLVGRAILINNRLNKKSADTKMEKEEGLESCRRGCSIDLRFRNPVVKI